MTSKKINCQLYVVKAAEDYTEHGIMQGDIFIVDDSQTEKRLMAYREFDTYESKKHPESPRGLIFFVKFIGYILRDLA